MRPFIISAVDSLPKQRTREIGAIDQIIINYRVVRLQRGQFSPKSSQ